MSVVAVAALTLLFGGSLAIAQEPPAPAPAEHKEGPSWSYSGIAYAYIVPDGRDYVQPTVTADYGALHLEGRYNYENLDTGSAWVGVGFSGGSDLTWDFTPMLGGVFGATDGIAPGYKGSLNWKQLSLYSEGEYVHDVNNNSDSFFYNWSELTFAPTEGFRFGMVVQRTRAYETDRLLQRGLLVGVTYERVSLTAHVFNPDESRPVVVLSLGVDF
jgi:hypothetical protein